VGLNYSNFLFWSTTSNTWQAEIGDRVHIGQNAGSTLQSTAAIAIGLQAGYNNQGSSTIAIGVQAGSTLQSTAAIAIGWQAGQTSQGSNTVTIGYRAGQNSQSTSAIAIGEEAGRNSQGLGAVAIGLQSGSTNQLFGGVGLGISAGQWNQSTGAIAIGSYAGRNNQGQYSIALGYTAGQENQASNSIALNATGTPFAATTANAFYVAPVRNTAGSSNLVLSYNTTTNEVGYTTSAAGGTATTTVTTSNITVTPVLTSSVSMTISTGLGYTPGTCVTVTNLSSIYYTDVLSSDSIYFSQNANIEVFMIGGGGGGGNVHAGAGGAGAYYTTGGTPISVLAGTTLAVTIGQGGAGATANTANGVNGTSTFIQSTPGTDFNALRVVGGGGGGTFGRAGSNGGCGGGGGSYDVSGPTSSISGGISNASTSPPNKTGSIGFNGGSGYRDGTNTLAGGGGGGAGGAGQNVLGGSAPNGGAGGRAISTLILNTPIVVGGGGGGGSWDTGGAGGVRGFGGSTVINGITYQVGGNGGYSWEQNQTAKAGNGVPNTGSGGGGGGSYGGTGGDGGSGRCIIRVVNSLLYSSAPISSVTGITPVQSFFSRFQGYISSYNSATGDLVIGNIGNITGSFSSSAPYVINLGSAINPINLAASGSIPTNYLAYNTTTGEIMNTPTTPPTPCMTVINGDMSVNQRGVVSGIPGVSGATYILDRWTGNDILAANGFSISQLAISDLPQFNYCMRISGTASATSTSALANMYNLIEARQVRELFSGATTVVPTVVLSFWTRSTVPSLRFSVFMQNNANTSTPTVGSYVDITTSATANTWNRVSAVFNSGPAVFSYTEGTFSATLGIMYSKSSAVASIRQSGPPGVWTPPSLLYGQMSNVAFNQLTASNTLDITGFQFDYGSVPSPYRAIEYWLQLQYCQRYFWQQNLVANNSICVGTIGNPTTTVNGLIRMPVEMRTNARYYSGEYTVAFLTAPAGSIADTFVTWSYSSPFFAAVYWTFPTAQNASVVIYTNTTSGYVRYGCE
jgi:hypothetical protein